jgi:COP9 signalosome complex subunit 7
MTALSISSPADLESLVTTAIYSSLLTARLSPASSPPTITVTSVAPLRDVKPQSVSHMVSVLADWQTRCGDVIGDIEGEIANIRARAEKERAGERARQAMSEKALNEWSGDKGVEAPASSGRAARRMGGAARFGIGNKREFSADDHEDDGYDEGGDVDPGLAGRMDVDEGAGSSSRFGSGMRHAKRVLGRKH